MIANGQLNATIAVYRTPQGAGKTRNEFGEVKVDFEEILTCRAFVDMLTEAESYKSTGGLVAISYRIFINYYQYRPSGVGSGKERFAADVQQDDRVIITQLFRGNQVDVGRKLRVQYSNNPGMYNETIEIGAYYETGGN